MSRFAKSNGVNNNKYSAPNIKMITGAEAGRHRGARRRNQTPRDNSSTFRLHRRMFARYDAGWQNSWQRGLERRRRCHHRPQYDFLMPSTRPMLLPGPKRGRKRKKRWRKRWNYVCLGIMVVPHVTPGVTSFRAVGMLGLGICGGVCNR